MAITNTPTPSMDDEMSTAAGTMSVPDQMSLEDQWEGQSTTQGESGATGGPYSSGLQGAAAAAAEDKRKGSSQKKSQKSGSSSSSSRSNPVKKKSEKKSVPVYDFNDLNSIIPEDYPVFVWKDGRFLQCIVLEHKEHDNLVDDTPTTIPFDIPQTIPYDYARHKYVYYVHYLRWDRRMDEWVLRDRIRFLPELKPYILPTPPHLVAQLAAQAHSHGDSDRKNQAQHTYNQALNPVLPEALAEYVNRPGIEIPDLYVENRDEALSLNTDDHGPFSEAELHEHNAATKVKNVNEIVLGPYIMPTWYHSPFPEEILKTKTLWFCENCLSFFAYQSELDRHKRRCTMRTPPGTEIYRSKETNIEICMYEVDGQREHVYCENLSYIAKLFLDHKTLHEDCSIFLYYVLCEVTERGCIPVGYFSKEKIWTTNNLACILTLPCHQRKGYGKFLISMSYELARIEDRVGGPERPLSDLGKVSYMTYWLEQLVKALDTLDTDEVSIQRLSEMTHIMISDVVYALKENRIVVWDKGKWVISKTQIQLYKDKKREAREAAKRREQEMIAAGIPIPKREYVRPAQRELIHWTPYNPAANRRRRAEEDAGILNDDHSGGGYGRSSLRDKDLDAE